MPVEPEIVAIGASSLMPVTANCAEVVEVPPIRRSTVVFAAYRVPDC